jgi:hypothetical protein
VRLAFAWVDATTRGAAPEEVEEDAPVRIGPGHESQARADLDAQTEFLVQLPDEAVLDRLAGLALAAGKLPEAAEMLDGIPFRHEEAPPARDDRSGHLHHREARSPRQLGEEPEKGRSVGQPRSGMPARVRGMEEDDHLAAVFPEASAVVVG